MRASTRDAITGAVAATVAGAVLVAYMKKRALEGGQTIQVRGGRIVTAPGQDDVAMNGLGADGSAPITRTTYTARCRAKGVRADQPKTPLVDRGAWQGNLMAQGFPNVTVDRVALAGFENQDTSVWKDSPTTDILFDITFTVETVPDGIAGLGAESGFLNNVLEALKRVGSWITAAVNFIVEKVTQVARAVGDAFKKGVDAVTPDFTKWALLAVGGVALLMVVAAKSRVRTARVAFGE